MPHPASAHGAIGPYVEVVMIEVGSLVRHKPSGFVGRVLGRHGSVHGVGGSYEFRSLPNDPNVMGSDRVLNEESGEVRGFVPPILELVEGQ